MSLHLGPRELAKLARELQNDDDTPTKHADTSGSAAGLQNGVVVPLLQAAITGVMFAGIVGALFALSWQLFAMLALVATAIVWMLLLTDTRRLLWGIETRLGRDMNRDGYTGEPVERVVLLGARHTTPADKPAAPDSCDLAAFVSGIPTHGTGLNAWPNLSRPAWTAYRQQLMAAGFADWTSYTDGQPNKTQGWALTADVDEILAYIEVEK